jgi:hypothetical protein
VLDDEDASIATVQVSRAAIEAEAAAAAPAEGAEAAEAPEPEVIRKAKTEDEE